MGPKKTLERIKYSFFWEGLRADVKKFCESCKECQLTRLVRIKDRSSSTPVARPELPFEVENMDLIGPIDPPSSKGHKYILCLVDQHTRWGEAVPLTSLSAKELSLEQSSRLLTVEIIVCSVCGFSVSRFVNFLFLVSRNDKISHKGQILLLGGACKETLPAPGNRSNERRYREEDLATTEEKKRSERERKRGS
ncbi:retrovirus-related Pol polyprotein from transposon opus [Trichonephila clavipes]|nr:retrovirus-related Pol polyprotein from transposon opus [Trichonephila clavipes]